MPISQYDTLNYAQYKPESMQEMWAPAQEMRQQHDALQQEYSNQESAAQQGLLGLNATTDPDALTTQQNYIQATQDAANDLATKGFIDSGRRRSLMDLKAQYNNQIVPLENQLQLRNAAVKQQQQMSLQDPTYRFKNANLGNVSLTQGLQNSNAFNVAGASGNQMYTTAANKMDALKNSMSQTRPDLVKSPLAFEYFTRVKSGMSPSAAANVMLGTKNADGSLKYDPNDINSLTSMANNVIDSTMSEYGVTAQNGYDDKTVSDLRNTVAQSVVHAVGPTTFGNETDQYGMHMAEQKAAQQQEYQNNFRARSEMQVPFLVNGDKAKTAQSVMSYLSSGKYKPSSSYDGVTVDYNTQLAKLRNTRGLTPKQIADNAQAASYMVQSKGLGKWFDPQQKDYERSLQVEQYARDHHIANIKDIIGSAQNDVIRSQKLSTTRYIDDNDNVAKQRILDNIQSGDPATYQTLVKGAVLDKNGNVDPSSVRFGNNPMKGLVVQYHDKQGNVKTTTSGYEAIGDRNLVANRNAVTGTGYGANNFTKLFSTAVNGSVNPDNFVSKGEFIKNPNGTYEGTRIHDRGKQFTTFTKDELNQGYDNPRVSQYLDAAANSIDNVVYSTSTMYNKANPTNTGGTK